MKKFLKILKEILKMGLVIVISITAIIVIAHFIFFTNQKYIFPVEIGKIELNYEVRPIGYVNCLPADAIESLDWIEKEQGYVDIEELEQLRGKIEGIDSGYIIYSYRRPLWYIRYYDGNKPILGDFSDGWGSFGEYGKDNGNVLYFYRVRQRIVEPYDGNV